MTGNREFSVARWEAWCRAGARLLDVETLNEAWKWFPRETRERHRGVNSFVEATQVWAGMFAEFAFETDSRTSSHKRIRAAIDRTVSLQDALSALNDKERRAIWEINGNPTTIVDWTHELVEISKVLTAVVTSTKPKGGRPPSLNLRSAIQEMALTWAYFVGPSKNGQYIFSDNFLSFCDEIVPKVWVGLRIEPGLEEGSLNSMVETVIAEWNRDDGAWFGGWLAKVERPDSQSEERPIPKTASESAAPKCLSEKLLHHLNRM